MKPDINYLYDSKGRTLAVQLPVTEWNVIVNKIKKYELLLKVKSDLIEAFNEVKKIRKGKIRKQNMSDFLNEL